MVRCRSKHLLFLRHWTKSRSRPDSPIPDGSPYSGTPDARYPPASQHPHSGSRPRAPVSWSEQAPILPPTNTSSSFQMSAAFIMPSATSPPSQAAQPAKSGLFKRLATKLRTPHPPSTPSTSASPAPAASVSKAKRKPTIHLPKAKAPTHANAFLSAEHREAALRARGLVPRRYRAPNGDTLPMSAQEAELDKRFSMLVEEPGSSESSDGESEARRIREAWLQRNAANDVAARSASELSSVDEDDELVISGPVSPRRPQVVEAHAELPMSPSRAELHGGTSGSGHSDPDDEDPASIPLPASPLSSRRGTTSAVVPVTNGVSVSELGEVVQEAGTPATPAKSADATKTHPTSAPASLIRAKYADSPLPPLPPTPSSSSGDARPPRTLTLPTLTVSPCTPRASIEQNMPALSPTRTTSSTATSDAPHTPQPADDLPRPSASSSDSGSAKLNTAVARPGKVSSAITAVIVESPAEDDDADHVPELPPPRLPAARGSQDSARRMGLFKRGASTHSTPGLAKAPRPSASLGNLRRSVTSSLAGRLRPRSALVVDDLAAHGARGQHDTDPAGAPAAAEPDDAQPREHLAAREGHRGRGEPAAERACVSRFLSRRGIHC
ncbi:hypothetical protein PHLGIDRAFT_387847 [Phlebiopsis gigantea 11061_1 CR5-6]|uniref:Uncharacterized protein n=1 Tax=Phlebiopsis gigantea (strain 11061_1 CR5-6) TaxID=745531 RepID=A0A0C3SBS8_PHLG1|nr:hypothetical protein PHLGIDRAFT_387847 [Phlebiopsis gigantea 11061_1 CR5-6]